MRYIFNNNIRSSGGNFPDDEGLDKPWLNDNTNTAMEDFWEGRSQWSQSGSNVERRSFVINSVKVWAIQ